MGLLVPAISVLSCIIVNRIGHADYSVGELGSLCEKSVPE